MMALPSPGRACIIFMFISNKYGAKGIKNYWVFMLSAIANNVSAALESGE
jgi:hypothetical protein